MLIEVGNYSIECDINPTVHDNSSQVKVPIKDIGFIYNCVFKQKAAFIRSVEAIREIYPDSKIRVFSDGGLDYSFLEDDRLEFSMEEDTVSPLKNINASNFLEEKNQTAMKIGMAATIDRLQRGLDYCNHPEWFCMTEPDVYIRLNELIGEIDGSVPVMRWGSVPVIGHTETLLKGIDIYLKNFKTLDKLTECFHAVGAFDLFLPILFALAGEQEVFSDEYTECLRNPTWKTSSHPVVHQYREFYEKTDHYAA